MAKISSIPDYLDREMLEREVGISCHYNQIHIDPPTFLKFIKENFQEHIMADPGIRKEFYNTHKQDCIAAYEELGGKEFIRQIAIENPEAFLRHLEKMTRYG